MVLHHTLQNLLHFTLPSPTYMQTYFRNSLPPNYVLTSVWSYVQMTYFPAFPEFQFTSLYLYHVNSICENNLSQNMPVYILPHSRIYLRFSLNGYGKYLVQHSLTFRDIGLLSQMGFIKPTQFHISTSINPLSHNFSFLDSSPSVLSLYTNLEN